MAPPVWPHLILMTSLEAPSPNTVIHFSIWIWVHSSGTACLDPSSFSAKLFDSALGSRVLVPLTTYTMGIIITAWVGKLWWIKEVYERPRPKQGTWWTLTKCHPSTFSFPYCAWLGLSSSVQLDGALGLQAISWYRCPFQWLVDHILGGQKTLQTCGSNMKCVTIWIIRGAEKMRGLASTLAQRTLWNSDAEEGIFNALSKWGSDLNSSLSNYRIKCRAFFDEKIKWNHFQQNSFLKLCPSLNIFL